MTELNANIHQTKGDNETCNPDPEPGSSSSKFVEKYEPYLIKTYALEPPVFVRGSGSWLYDMEKRAYLDFSTGFSINNLGHSNPELATIIAEQAGILIHPGSRFNNIYAGPLAKLLVEKTRESGGFEAAAVSFMNLGAESVEAAIKYARKIGKELESSGKKHEIVYYSGAFHGRTMGALSASPNWDAASKPLVPGFVQGEFNDIEQVKSLITEKTCGVLIELIQGAGGVNLANLDFIKAISAAAKSVGAVMIHDEIQCGLGRTGKLWAHTSMQLPRDCFPDIVCTAKSLGAGFPFGAVLVTREVSDKIDFDVHGSSFGGGPLACRIGMYVVTHLSDPSLHADVCRKGEMFFARLGVIKQRHPSLIKDVRGMGLLVGVEINNVTADYVLNTLRQRGLLSTTAENNTVKFLPSLNISSEDLTRGLDIIEQTFDYLASSM